MSDWKEHLIPVRGGKLRVRERGTGPAVLFVHGALVNGHLWDAVAEQLHDVRAIVPDLPLGAHHHPMDDDADLSFRANADRLVQVLDHLGIEQAAVVANDTGGVAAQNFLVHHGERASGALLTNIDCYDNFPPRGFSWFPGFMQIPGALWLSAQAMRTRPGRRLPFTLGLLVRPMDNEEANRVMGPLWNSAGTRRDLKRACKTIARSQTLELAERFDRFKGPVHVAWTDKDPLFPPRYADRLAADFPGGVRVEPIANSKSLSPVDQPDQVAARLRDLVKRLRAAA